MTLSTDAKARVLDEVAFMFATGNLRPNDEETEYEEEDTGVGGSPTPVRTNSSTPASGWLDLARASGAVDGDGALAIASSEDIIYAEGGFIPPKAAQNAALQGLELRASLPPSNRGGTAVGIARARDIAAGKALSLDTIKRCFSFFSRHEVDKDGEGWEKDSKGWQAHLLWGGDPMKAFVKRILKQEESADHSEDRIKVGTTVSWKWQNGTSTGKVIKIFRDRVTLKLNSTDVTRNGSEDNPAILVEQESGARALKLASEVSVGADYAETEVEKDLYDYYSEQAMEQAAPIFDGWLNTLESQLFDGAESLEEVRDRVESIFSELPAEDFSALMSDLLIAGYGAGRYQVIQETEEDKSEEFAEPENTPIEAPELLAAVRRILAKFYTDGIDAIASAYVDEDNNIQGVFLDYINTRLTKRFAFIITDDDVSYRLLNPSQVEGADFSEEDLLDFAAPKQCKKGVACGKSCISANKTCKKPMTAPQTQTKQAVVTAVTGTPPTGTTTKPKKTRTKTSAPVPTPVVPATNATGNASKTSPIKTNVTELDKSRSDLIKRLGQKTVEDAEKNVQKILNSSDTNVFVRVGSADTLEKILGDRFKTSAELGTDTHQIPYLKDGYQKARNRVEAKVLGYDESSTKPEDRPIYGYLGSSDLNGASHANISDYGSIALKLKPEVKDRATFTGADSFKSGIASEVTNAGTPPPPNAASLVSTTRHGYDRASLPKHYPSYYSDDSADGGQLRGAAKAKNIDQLAPKLAITGNAYVEAQIHGGVTSKDIDEIHFQPSKGNDRPTKAIAQFAKDNNVKLFVNGKLADPDEIIKNAPDSKDFSNRANHKPFMTESEANDYVKNSVFGNKTFYHGTSGAGADSITTKGVDISLNRVALYGQGFYLGGDRFTAKGYASGKSKPTVLSAKLDMRNPLVVDDFTDVAASAGTGNSKKQRTNLMKQGYDGVHVRGMEYYVAFDPKQVAVYKKEKA